MKLKILTLVSAIGMMVSVLAIPVKADGSFALGVIGNMATFDISGSERESGEGGKRTTEGKHSVDVDFASIFVEGTVRSDSLGLTLGAEWVPGDAELGAKSRTDSNDENSGGNDGTYTAKAEISNHMSVYVEPTLYYGNFGVYGKAGAARVNVNTLESIALGTDSSVYGDEDTTGFLRGVGLRATFGHILIKTEYLKTNYSKVKFTSNSGNKNVITATPESETVRVAIGFQF